MFESSLFPFSSLTNSDLAVTLSSTSFTPTFAIDSNLKDLFTNVLTDDIIKSTEFKYYTPGQFDNMANRNKATVQLSIFHVNVRSLNANFNKLINYLQCLNFDFDVLILSEIWSTNIDYYVNLFKNYDFFYELPKNKAGGVGIFVAKLLGACQTLKYEPCFPNNKFIIIYS